MSLTILGGSASFGGARLGAIQIYHGLGDDIGRARLPNDRGILATPPVNPTVNCSLTLGCRAVDACYLTGPFTTTRSAGKSPPETANPPGGQPTQHGPDSSSCISVSVPLLPTNARDDGSNRIANAD